MPEHPLAVFDRADPEFRNLIERNREFALSDGALPRRTKLLIAMALDAAHGTVDGVNSLTQQALDAGATKEEITEALRVTQFISGVGSTYTAARGIKDLF